MMSRYLGEVYPLPDGIRSVHTCSIPRVVRYFHTSFSWAGVGNGDADFPVSSSVIRKHQASGPSPRGKGIELGKLWSLLMAPCMLWSKSLCAFGSTFLLSLVCGQYNYLYQTGIGRAVYSEKLGGLCLTVPFSFY